MTGLQDNKLMMGNVPEQVFHFRSADNLVKTARDQRKPYPVIVDEFSQVSQVKGQMPENHPGIVHADPLGFGIHLVIGKTNKPLVNEPVRMKPACEERKPVGMKDHTFEKPP